MSNFQNKHIDEFAKYLYQTRPMKICGHPKILVQFHDGRYVQGYFCKDCGTNLQPRERMRGDIEECLTKHYGHPDLNFPVYSLPGIPFSLVQELHQRNIYSYCDALRVFPLGDTYNTGSIASSLYKKVIAKILEHCSPLRDPLGDSDLQQLDLMDLSEAYDRKHNRAVSTQQQEQQAQKRLCFDNLMRAQRKLLRNGRRKASLGGLRVTPGALTKAYVKSLPFSLTTSQRKILGTVTNIFNKGTTADVLIQGDVGSGKTAIALGLATMIAEAGGQTAIMAPTSVLARQHYNDLVATLKPLGIRVDCLVADMTTREKRTVVSAIESGENQVLVGTMSIAQKKVSFANLALVVIDEQHRFGVRQREALISKGSAVHVVNMTATPIPRSLALSTQAGQILTNDSIPAGRKKTITTVIRDRLAVDAALDKALKEGQQAYVVTPLVEENVELELISATEEFTRLSNRYSTGLLHGKMTADEKESVLENFKKGLFDVLVSTTVVEVGVNNPNANTIVIYDAERHGVASLHQLRGRVGRGGAQGHCYLHSASGAIAAEKRLQILVESTDGFHIAEQDALCRGPGDLFGTKQSGFFALTQEALENPELIQAARMFVQKLAS